MFKALILTNGAITSTGAVLLAKCITENPYINQLNLSCNDIGPRGFQAISEGATEFLKCISYCSSAHKQVSYTT